MTTHDKLAAAREEGRNQGLLEAAEVALEHVDLFRTKSADRAYNEACFNIEDAILALIDTPAPPSNTTHWECPVCQESATWNKSEPPYCGQCAADNGRDVRMVPAPQPDADEREALVAVIAGARGHFTPSEMAWAGDGYHDEDRRVADALLEAGWTRKREEG